MSFYAAQYNRPIPTLCQNTLRALTHYHWPENVRELKDIIQSLIAGSNTPIIELGMLPDKILSSLSTQPKNQQSHATHLPLWQIEKRAIEGVMHQCRGNIVQAAQILNISPSTIYRKKKEWKRHNNPAHHEDVNS